jgi:putative transposase
LSEFSDAKPQLLLRFAEAEPERFWQPRFYDFNVWSAKKRKEKLEYMHRNPITRRLVEHPRDWPWRSFTFYVTGQTGLVPIDRVG